MNSHSFLEWLLWNPSFIMAGFQLVVLSERISQDQNETSSLKRKKVLAIQKAKVLAASCRGAVTEDPWTFIERYVPTYWPECVSSWNDGFTAGGWSFPVQKVTRYKKCSTRWVGGRVWRLLLTWRSSSWAVDSKDCWQAPEYSALHDLMMELQDSQKPGKGFSECGLIE